MEKENILKFNDKELFSNKILHQYDEDGQKGFLGFLLRYKQWEIVNNNIIFPNIKTQQEIVNLLGEYEYDEKIQYTKIRQQAIRNVKYFVDHPEMILGKMEMTSGRFGLTPTCTPYEIPLENLLDQAIININSEIEDYQIDLEDEEEKSIPADPSVRNFSYTIVDNQIYYRENSRMYLQDIPVTATSRIKGNSRCM